MTIARAQMYRQLYQLGGSPTGIATMPMDYGQPLQVPQQQPLFTTTGSATSSPLLNYGQTGLGQAGGTPLTRNGYQEGGLSDFYKAEEPIIPRIENIGGLLDQAEKSIGEPQNNFTSPLANTFSRFGMQEGGMGMMQPQASQMDPKQALELIIQMLIEQGIPPEQAREIAIQMVQAVAEGGMEEMNEERVEARFGGRIGYASGGIGSLVNREQYGFGSFISAPFKAAGKLVKGAVNAVKKVAKSDLGKAALTVAAIYASGGGFSPQGFSMFGSQAGPGLLGSTGTFDLGSSVIGQGLFGTPGTLMPGDVISGGSKGLFGNLGITPGFGTDLFSGGISSLLPSKSTLLASGLGGVLGGALGGAPKREDFGSDEEYEQAVAQWKSTLQSRLDQPNPQFAGGLFPNNPFYPQRAANGGRIGYGFGSLAQASGVVEPVQGGTISGGGSGFGGMISRILQQNPNIFKQLQSSTTPVAPSNGIADLIKQTTKQTYFENMKPLYNYDLEDLYNLRKENNDYMYANGGRIGYALGAEVPTRENQAGVQELDYRQTGGFVPPIGIKEKADDIPAMLSNNEFVFTADAVRNAGGGNVNKGAERMYSLMKNLENGGRV